MAKSQEISEETPRLGGGLPKERALEALVQKGDLKAVRKLLEGAGPQKSTLMAWAVVELTEKMKKEGQENLNSKFASIVAFARIAGRADAEKEFISYLEDEHENSRERGAFGLGEIRSRKGIPLLIAQFETEPNFPNVKYEAVEALVKIGKPAVKQLIRGLDHYSKSRRGRCAAALGRIGDPEALDALIARFAVEKRLEVYAIAVGMIGGEKAYGALTSLLKQKKRWEVNLSRHDILEAIYLTKDPRGLEMLLNSILKMKFDRQQGAISNLMEYGELSLRALFAAAQRREFARLRPEISRVMAEINERMVWRGTRHDFGIRERKVPKSERELMRKMAFPARGNSAGMQMRKVAVG